MSKINIDELLKILPKLIRENDTVKGAIISALSGVVATHEDIVELSKAMNERFESMDKRFESIQNSMNERFKSMDKRFESIQNSMNERFESMDKRFESIQQTMDKRFEILIEQMNRGFEEARKDRQELRVSISSISSRSGEKLEELILNMLSDKLVNENIQKSKITHKDLIDREGKVYYKNYTTNVDVVIQNGKTLLMEVKSTADNRDVFDLIQKGKLYELQTGEKYDGLILACLEINRTNFEQAVKQGVRIIAGKIT
ncbi:MAG: hypothetical protein BAJALOKI2v1_50048 [Promethearchaeota archaeon]|nr:MAG: hypothetical protein BAJALOKI2v1_50048 [Candidatus Lokiarchaeota archaeon]